MNVDDTVRLSLYNYPSLYTDRWAVFEHILCGYGTGYDWVDGELVDTLSEATEEHRRRKPLLRDADAELERMIAEHRSDAQRRNEFRAADDQVEVEPSEFLVNSWRELAAETAERVRYVHDNLDELTHTRKQPQHVGEMSRPARGLTFSPLASIPDDVTSDWLDACQEAAEFVLASERSNHLWDADINPQERKPVSREMREMLHSILEEASGGPVAPLPPDEELAVQYAAEREQRFAADSRAVKKNHAIAREALERIAVLRAQRAQAAELS